MKFLTRIYSIGLHPDRLYWLGFVNCEHGLRKCQYNTYCYQCFKTSRQYTDILAQKIAKMAQKRKYTYIDSVGRQYKISE